MGTDITVRVSNKYILYIPANFDGFPAGEIWNDEINLE